MKVPQHPNIALAIEALEKSNMDAAWHLLRAVPTQVIINDRAWIELTVDERKTIISNSLTPACVVIATEAKIRGKNA
jgi:hypothetical protein